MSLKPRWYDSIFVVLFFYLFVLQVQAIWSFTIDDMFISLRYARHWAAGDGLLWNLNAPPVEGYSNFSFVVLGALTLMLKGDPLIILKIAGLCGLFFSCCFLFLITRFWFCWREALLPCLLLLLYRGQIIWSVSGLETAVYEALIAAAVYFIIRAMGYAFFPEPRAAPKNRFFVVAALLLSLAGMTRPEAPVFMLVFFLLLCWDRPKTELRKYRQGVFLFTLVLAFSYLPYFMWRLYYFGFLFPNAIYCKGLSTVFNLTLDLNYLKLIWPFALLALLACIGDKDKRYYFLCLPSFVYLLLLVNTDPIVAFDNRLFLPAFALLLPLALQGISVVLLRYFNLETTGASTSSYYSEHSTDSRYTPTAVSGLIQRDKSFFMCFYFVFFVMAFLFIPRMTLAQYHHFTRNPLKGEQLRGRVVQWLRTHAVAGSSIVLGDSGLIPYYSDLTFIDSYCLNNLAMAHYPEGQRYTQFCQKIILKQPEIIILTSLIERGKVVYAPSDACLKKLLNKQSAYKLVRTFNSENRSSFYRYELFTYF